MFSHCVFFFGSHQGFVQSSGSYAFIVPFVRSPRRRSSPGQGVDFSKKSQQEIRVLVAGGRGRQQVAVGGSR